MATKNFLDYNENTIVMFHVGRGGRFHNPGCKSFEGVHTISQCSDFCDLFIKYENQDKIMSRLINKSNLLEKFVDCLATEDFTFFTKLGFDLGEKKYIDQSGNFVELTEKDVETGVGTINLDNEYDTTYTKLVKDLSESEIQIIRESDRFEKESLTDLFEELEMI